MATKLALVLAAGIAMVAMTFSAQALPMAPGPQGYQSNYVIHVAGHCGPHRHRNRHGHCVHN
jgi:Spy/CpxP family protein refolding chaperone